MFWRRVGPRQVGVGGSGGLEQEGRQAEEALGGRANPHRHLPCSERAARPRPAAKQKALQASGASGPSWAAEKATSATAPELSSGTQATYSSPGRGRQVGPEGAPHPILHPRSHHLRPSNSCVALTPTPRLVSPPHTYVVPWSRGPLRPFPQSVCPSPCNYFSRAAVPQSPSATIGWRPLKTGRVPAGCFAKLSGREGPSVSRPPALTTAAVQQGAAEEGPAGQRAGPSTRGRLRPHHTDLLLLCPTWQPGQTTVTLQRVPAQVSAGGGAGSEGRCGGPRAQLPTATKTNKTYISLKLNKLANIPSSNVEILLLLMSLKERRDSTWSDASPLNRNNDRQPPPAQCVESRSSPGGDTHSSVSAERFARSPMSSARSRLWETSLESKAAAGQCWGPRHGTESTRAHLRCSPAAASHLLSSLFPGPEVEDLNELSSGEPEAGESWPLSTPSMPCPFPSHPLPPAPSPSRTAPCRAGFIPPHRVQNTRGSPGVSRARGPAATSWRVGGMWHRPHKREGGSGGRPHSRAVLTARAKSLGSGHQS